MELSDYLRVFRRNWITVAASVLLGVFIAAAASLIAQPTYSAKTQLFVAIQSSGSVTELQQGNTFTQARVQSYVKTASTPAVLQPVIDSLALETTPAQLATKVQASADLETVLINISAEDSSPVQAAAIAQGVGTSLIKVVEGLEQPSVGGTSPVKLSVITPAVAPSSPSAPNTSLNMALGLVIGLGAGLGLAVLRSTLDTRVRGADDLDGVSDAAVLGGITFDSEATGRPLLTQTGAQSPRAESFRQIRTNLQFASVSSESTALLVTSSLPGEGKSTTATNMAIAMAQEGKRVVLVDADLRRPTIAQYLGLESQAGLTTALIKNSSVQDLLQPWGEDELHVLTSGQIPPNPSELLGSQAMSDLITHLESIFDIVIIDAPPLIPVTDAAVLAQKVGGVVLVVGAARIRTKDLQKSIDSLKLVNAHLLGIVLNLLPSKGPDAYGYSYYSYHSQPQAPVKKRKRATSQTPTGSHMNAARRERKADTSYSHAAGDRH